MVLRASLPLTNYTKVKQLPAITNEKTEQFNHARSRRHSYQIYLDVKTYYGRNY